MTLSNMGFYGTGKMKDRWKRPPKRQVCSFTWSQETYVGSWSQPCSHVSLVSVRALWLSWKTISLHLEEPEEQQFGSLSGAWNIFVHSKPSRVLTCYWCFVCLYAWFNRLNTPGQFAKWGHRGNWIDKRAEDERAARTVQWRRLRFIYHDFKW